MARGVLDVDVDVQGQRKLDSLNRGLESAQRRSGGLSRALGGLRGISTTLFRGFSNLAGSLAFGTSSFFGVMGAVVQFARSKFTGSLTSLAGHANSLADSVSGLSGGLAFGPKSLLLALIAVASFIGYKLVSSFLSTNDQIGKLATRLGISTDALQEWRFAAEQTGTSIETIERGVKALSLQIGGASNGSTEAQRNFDKLGVSWQALQRMSPEEQFRTIVDALSRVEDQTLRTELSQRLLGESGVEMGALIKGGTAALDEYAQQAREAGRVVDEETIRNSEKLNDTINRIKSTFQGFVNRILTAALPAFQRIADVFEKELLPVIEKHLIPIIEEITVKGLPLLVGAVRAAIAAFRFFFEKVLPTASRVYNRHIKPVIEAIIFFFAADGESEGYRSLSGVLNFVGRKWDDIFGGMVRTIRGWAAWVSERINAAGRFIAGIPDLLSGAVKDAWDAVWLAIGTVVSSVWDGIKTTVEDVVVGIAAFFVGIKDHVVRVGSAIWRDIRDTAVTLWNTIRTKVEDTIVAIGAFLGQMKDWVVEKAGAIWDDISGAATTAWDAVKTTVEDVVVAVGAFLVGIKDDVVGKATAIWDAIKEAASSAWDAVKTTVEDVVAAIGAFFVGIYEDFTGKAAALWNTIRDTASTVWETIRTTVEDAVVAIGAFFVGIKDDIVGKATALWNTAKTKASDLWDDIKTKIEDVVVAVGAFFVSIKDDVVSKAGAIWTTIKDRASDTWDDIKGIPGSAFTSIKSAFDSAKNTLLTAWRSVWNPVKDFFVGVWNTILGVVNGVISAMNTAIALANEIPGVNIGPIPPVGGTSTQGEDRDPDDPINRPFQSPYRHYNRGGAGSTIGSGVLGFANGGVVTRPTLAMVGERGPEVITPLTGPNAGKGATIINNYNIHVAGSVIEEQGLARTIERVANEGARYGRLEFA